MEIIRPFDGDRVSAAMFDLDGTLVYSLPSLYISSKLTMQRMGLGDLPEADFSEKIGYGAREQMRRCLAALGDVEAKRLEEAQAVYKDVFAEHCCDNLTLYPGVHELLEGLKTAGISRYLLSNKPQANVEQVAASVFERDDFSRLLGQREGLAVKPDTAMVHLLMEQDQLLAQEIMMFGDSEPDMQMAKRAGIYAVAVTWGYRKREQLIAAGADVLVDTAEEALAYVLRYVKG